MWQPWGLTPTVRFRFRNCGDIQKYEKGTQATRLGALRISWEARMESAFAWLNQLVQTFYRFLPHILIVRATHGGVSVAHSVM